MDIRVHLFLLRHVHICCYLNFLSTLRTMSQHYIISCLRSNSWKQKDTFLLRRLIRIGSAFVRTILHVSLTWTMRFSAGVKGNCKLWIGYARLPKKNTSTVNRGVLRVSWRDTLDDFVSNIALHENELNHFMGCNV